MRTPGHLCLLIVASMLWTPRLRADVAIDSLRFTDPVIAGLLGRGAARSPTFRSLLQRVGASNLIVYVERRQRESGPAGFTQFLAGTSARRYVRIVLSADERGDGLVALLGHELRHAVEIAESPSVVDQETYKALYEAIGRSSCGPPRWCFDTDAARDAGERVLRELRQPAERTRAPGMARQVTAEMDGALLRP